MEKQKTALVLGGGGARGAYEVGVWQALREMDYSIDMVVGASVGAINGVMVVQDAFDLTVKLWSEMQTDQILGSGLVKKDDLPLRRLMEHYIDERAARESKIEFGLVTTEFPRLEPRYFYLEDIPKGKLVDYILASASLFPAIKAQDIDHVKYVDGGYLDNLPVDMAIKKGATHIIAVDLSTAGIVRKEPLRRAQNLIHLHCPWDLGAILLFDSMQATRLIRLGYLDTLKAFGFHDGDFYCFLKGEWAKRDLALAESAGKIFDLSPLHIYTKDVFEQRLAEAVASYRKETEREFSIFRHQLKQHRLQRKPLLDLLGKWNEKTRALLILDYLKEHPVNRNALLSKSVLTFFKKEAQAAGFLFRKGLG